MNNRKTQTLAKQTAQYNQDDILAALCGQLTSMRKAVETIARNREKGEILNENGKLSFKFTKQEIKTMPEPIKKVFLANNFIVNYRITSNGYYEARIRRKDMYVEASGRDFETMRRRFLDRLAAFYKPKTAKPDPNTVAQMVYFTDYAEDWLAIKEQTTKPSTFKEYKRSYNADLKPTFYGKRLNEITRADLQSYLFSIIGEGKHGKAEKLALMLNCIFDMAAEDFGITSPMKRVVLPYREQKKGQALTKDEELRLVNYCKTHRHLEGTDALLVLLYFGLRRSELKSIEIIDDKWLQCETSKERMGQNVVLRKIPFTPMAKKVLPFIDFEKAKNVNLNTLAMRIKKLLPEHHLHELRHTFVSRCKESGVTGEVVSIWAGHSLSGTITSTVYTHYSDEFQLKEAEKVDY